MLAHLVIDLLVAQVAFDAQVARALRRDDDLARVGICVFGDGDDGLQRREPERQVAGIVFQQDAEEALSSEPNMARWSITGVTLFECSSI